MPPFCNERDKPTIRCVYVAAVAPLLSPHSSTFLSTMRVTAIVPALLAYSSTVVGTCYFPSGNVVDSDTACNPNALVSSCCYDNQACLSNGLCVSDPHDPAKARLHRGTCTDKTWKSGNCVRQCLGTSSVFKPVYTYSLPCRHRKQWRASLQLQLNQS